VLGLLGPNGAGKTSTLQMLAGNLAPSAGRILIDGVDLLDEPLKAKGAIGYLPEVPPLYPDLTVDEYLLYAAARTASGPAPARGLRQRQAALWPEGHGPPPHPQPLQGLPAAGGHRPSDPASPTVMILDEPTVGLDPIQIREIRELIAELGKETRGDPLHPHPPGDPGGMQPGADRAQGRMLFADTLAGLAERMEVTSLVLECRQLPGLKELRAIEGVEAVEKLDSRRVRLCFSAGADPAENARDPGHEGGWGLRGLTPEYKSWSRCSWN